MHVYRFTQRPFLNNDKVLNFNSVSTELSKKTDVFTNVCSQNDILPSNKPEKKSLFKQNNVLKNVSNQNDILPLNELKKPISLPKNDITLNTYDLKDVKTLVFDKNHKYINNYNCCSIDDFIIYRSGNLPNWLNDVILCSKITNDFKIIPETTKRIHVMSKYPNNMHVEDPRVIFHKNYYFLAYTDGYNIGVAKLDLNCNVVYTHYLEKPKEIKFEGGDGREKNWLPISMGNEIYFWYSDMPRTFLIYEDTLTELKYKSFYKTEQRVTCSFGNVRGGCPPVDFKNGLKIWFFHTLFKKTYHIGAYITKDFKVLAVTKKPVLSGLTFHKNGQHIVFPCGAVLKEDCYYITMGLRDKEIGILKISIKDIEFV